MNLSEAYELIRPAVVAFSPKYVPLPATQRPPAIPPIVGTGFIVADGMVVTNDHVIEALLRAPKPPEAPIEEFPFVVQLLHFLEKNEISGAPTGGVARIPLEVLGVFKLGELKFSESGYYYGPRKPDFSVVDVKAKGLPVVELMPDASKVREGVEVGALGYPSGSDLLTPPGWLHHVGPTLQKGIVSAVLPFRCPAPHSFLVEIMSLGGASGSPVFLADDPRAIGILNAGFEDLARTFSFDHRGIPVERDYVRLGTSLSYVVPALFLDAILKHIADDKRFQLPPDTKSLADILTSGRYLVSKEAGKHNEPPKPGDIIIPEPEGPVLSVNVNVTERRAENGSGRPASSEPLPKQVATD
jgi:Trypsin-like peptidase domain